MELLALPQRGAKMGFGPSGALLDNLGVIVIQQIMAIPNDLQTRDAVIDRLFGQADAELDLHPLCNPFGPETREAENRKPFVLLPIPPQALLDRLGRIDSDRRLRIRRAS